MVTIVYERMPNIDGQPDVRPLAIFNNLKDARKFLRVLAANQIYASMKDV